MVSFALAFIVLLKYIQAADYGLSPDTGTTGFDGVGVNLDGSSWMIAAM